MQSWKVFEKEVARRLDGVRVIRERWDKRDCDIRHPVFSIECKLRGTIGLWYGQLLKQCRAAGRQETIQQNCSKFVLDCLKQAEGYAPQQTNPPQLAYRRLIPVAVIKLKGTEYDDALVFMGKKDFPYALIPNWIFLNGMEGGQPSRPVVYTGLREFSDYWTRYKEKLLYNPAA